MYIKVCRIVKAAIGMSNSENEDKSQVNFRCSTND